MHIKTILVDDEPLALLELQTMLYKYPEIVVIDTARNALEAVQKANTLKPDLLFLDINLPGKSGFDILQELEEVPLVIFVTAYDQFAIKAFEVNALDYILKPINTDRLKEAIEKIRKQVVQNKPAEEQLTIDKRIFIKDGEHCYFIPLKEIFLIESVGNYARMFFQNKKPLLHKSLNYLEEKLPQSHFFRTDRQHIINTDFITSIAPFFNNSLQIELKNDIKIEISQRQSVKFKERMGI